MEAAGGHIYEAMGWLGEVNRDLDIIGQMQGSSYNETNSRLLSITTGSGGTASASTTNPAAGSEVLLYAGQNPAPTTETMPDLRGLSYEAARQRLGELGLYLTAENGVTDPAAQLVSAQSTAPGEELAHGSVVGVTLYENEASMLGEY